MDFEAGLPILVASLVAVILFTWLQLERSALENNLRIYASNTAYGITGRINQVRVKVRKIVISSTIAAPAIMLFSGQLDAHGIAQAFDGKLQIIAPFTSACFSAATAWMLIISPLVVHNAHCQLLALFCCARQRKEFW